MWGILECLVLHSVLITSPCGSHRYGKLVTCSAQIASFKVSYDLSPKCMSTPGIGSCLYHGDLMHCFPSCSPNATWLDEQHCKQ